MAKQMDDDDDVEILKRPITLLVGDKVEVRSVDEGLMGSWHSGVVIECRNGSRKIKYDNFLFNNNSQMPNDCVTVHPVLDGVTFVGRKRLCYRGFIRPFPPPLNFDRFSLHYGQCVDAYYKEAWWEGVIFDRENCDVRSIFFPDLGDVLQVGVDVLRITQDWDEYTRDWRPRGNWYFLELMEKHEQEDLLHVSIRQIWYEVREKKAFRLLKEWTNSHTKGCFLEKLVKEVIADHSYLASEKYYGELVESISSINNYVDQISSHIYPCVSKTSAKINITGQDICEFPWTEICRDSVNKTRREEVSLNKTIISHSDTTNEETLFGVPSLVPCKASSVGVCPRSKELSGICEQVHSKKDTKRKWEVAGSDLVPVAEFCPSSVVKYLSCLSSKGTKKTLMALNMRKHLAYLGWKVEVCKEDGYQRMRYTSPIGKSYTSLATVCKDWDFSVEMENTLVLHPNDIVEHPSFPETDSAIGTNEALNIFNSLSTTCEAYAVGEVGNGKLTTGELSPSKVSIDLVKSGQSKSLVEEEHQHKRINKFGDDVGAEVSDVGLATAEESMHVDTKLSESTTEEEGKKLDVSLSTDFNSATHVEAFPGALWMNYSNILKLQGSNVISDDFCTPISENLAQKHNYFGGQISGGHNYDFVREAEICPDSIYKSKMERGDRLDLLSSSNSQITDDETPLKKRKKRNWEIAGGDMVPEAEFCPNSVSEYLKVSSIKNGKAPSSLVLDMRKHLSYLGWKIEFCSEVGSIKMRYISPDGKSYHSLSTVCKDLDTSNYLSEGKKVCAGRDIAEPAYLAETVKKYALLGSGKYDRNTALPRITEPYHDMENRANKDLMASEPLLWRNGTLKTVNSLVTTGKVNSSGSAAIISDQEKNIKNLDEVNRKLIATESFPSNIIIEHAEFAQVKPMILEEHETERINDISSLTCNDDDVGMEVKGVTEKEEFCVDVDLSISNIEEESKNSDMNLLSSSNPVSDDFCPIFEKLDEKKDCYGYQIAGHNNNMVLETEIFPDSLYRSKIERGRKMDIINIPNLKTADEESLYCLPSIQPCNKAIVNFSRVEDMNIVGEEISLKKRRKLDWEIAGKDVVPEADFCPDSVFEFCKSSNSEHGKTLPSLGMNKRENLAYAGWKVEICRGEEKNNTTEWFRNEHFEDIHDKVNRPDNSVITACEGYADGKINDDVEVPLVSEPNQNIIAGDMSTNKLSNIQTSPPNLPTEIVETEKDTSLSVGNHHNDSSFSIHSSRSLLSLLIDNDMVLPRAKVYYRKKSGVAIKEGQITHEGIICNCCQSTFGLSRFEVHTGSTNHRPAANLFLEDGRSLSECQSQLKCRDNLKSMSTPQPQLKLNRDTIKNIPKSCDKIKKTVTPSLQLKRGRRVSMHDYLCSVCNIEGVAILCHHCPSSFHRECLGRKDIPEGEWFCPSCCCGICENNKFNNGAKKIMDGSILNCYQCERQYHVGCLLKRGDLDLSEGSRGKWFCNRKCKQIFVDLRKLLGRPIVVGDDNLTWTLLKYTSQNDDMEGDEMDRVEILNSLRTALSVMHECFDPVKEPRTKIDIINDVIFSKGSTVQRLNFQGFYTVLLSRDDDLISVAALRVHGEKVAEVPLIGTRFEYQRGGMCRLLMNVIEKKLLELGVERLVFLATPNVLNTWTSSFGFSKISESERKNLLSYTFLDFQGTAMCHKLLTKSAQLIRTQQNFHGSVNGNKNSASAEVIHAEETEVEILHQGTADVALSNRRINDGIGTSPLILRV